MNRTNKITILLSLIMIIIISNNSNLIIAYGQFDPALTPQQNYEKMENLANSAIAKYQQESEQQLKRIEEQERAREVANSKPIVIDPEVQQRRDVINQYGSFNITDIKEKRIDNTLTIFGKVTNNRIETANGIILTAQLFDKDNNNIGTVTGQALPYSVEYAQPANFRIIITEYDIFVENINQLHHYDITAKALHW